MSGNKNPVVEIVKLLDIHIQSQDGSILIIRVPSGVAMKVVFKTYCRNKQIIDYKSVRFLFNGKRIHPTNTVDEVGIEDGDQIDAMLEQDGGGLVN